MNQKIKELSEDYVSRITKEFKEKEFITVLYGSAADGTVDSDFDVCTFFHDYTENDAEKTGKITFDFHKDNNMKIDNEVPFENKTIYSFFDIEKMFLKPPFPIYRNKFYIPQIEKIMIS